MFQLVIARTQIKPLFVDLLLHCLLYEIKNESFQSIFFPSNFVLKYSENRNHEISIVNCIVTKVYRYTHI